MTIIKKQNPSTAHLKTGPQNKKRSSPDSRIARLPDKNHNDFTEKEKTEQRFVLHLPYSKILRPLRAWLFIVDSANYPAVEIAWKRQSHPLSFVSRCTSTLSGCPSLPPSAWGLGFSSPIRFFILTVCRRPVLFGRRDGTDKHENFCDFIDLFPGFAIRKQPLAKITRNPLWLLYFSLGLSGVPLSKK
ncbi:MAG: hypothetical protein AB7E77_11860 [Desulfobulbus sp.]